MGAAQGRTPRSTHGAWHNALEKPPRIISCAYGNLLADGRTFSCDVLLAEGVLEGWWRVEVHQAAPCDLLEALSFKVELVIIGTGCNGRLLVLPETVEFLESHGLEGEIHLTPHACIRYN